MTSGRQRPRDTKTWSVPPSQLQGAEMSTADRQTAAAEDRVEEGEKMEGRLRWRDFKRRIGSSVPRDAFFPREDTGGGREAKGDEQIEREMEHQ